MFRVFGLETDTSLMFYQKNNVSLKKVTIVNLDNKIKKKKTQLVKPIFYIQKFSFYTIKNIISKNEQWENPSKHKEISLWLIM